MFRIIHFLAKLHRIPQPEITSKSGPVAFVGDQLELNCSIHDKRDTDIEYDLFWELPHYNISVKVLE